MNVMLTMAAALRSATTLLAAMSASVRMDTDWTQMDTPAMVRGSFFSILIDDDMFVGF